jgi:hypothetical protein
VSLPREVQVGLGDDRSGFTATLTVVP